MMTKDELKKLSHETFFDNEAGGITPSEQRAFNDKIIENMITTNEVICSGMGDKFLTDDGQYRSLSEAETDITPIRSASFSLGNSKHTWNTVYTESISAENEEATIQLNSFLIPIENNRINLGSESSEFLDLHVHRINGSNFTNTTWTESAIFENASASSLYWSISGNSLFLSGEYTHISGNTSSISITNIPEIYLKRMLSGNYMLYLKDNNQEIHCILGSLSVIDEKLIITSLHGDYPFTPNTTFVFSSFIIPLLENKYEVLRTEKGIDHEGWDYSQLTITNCRNRIVKPWIRNVYANDSRGEKIYGESYIDPKDTEEVQELRAKASDQYRNYTIAEDNLTATRENVLFYLYVFPDIEILGDECGVNIETADIDAHQSDDPDKGMIFGYQFSDYLLPAVIDLLKTHEYSGAPFGRVKIYNNVFFVAIYGSLYYSYDGFKWFYQNDPYIISRIIDFTYSPSTNKMIIMGIDRRGLLHKYIVTSSFDDIVNNRYANWKSVYATEEDFTCISEAYKVVDKQYTDDGEEYIAVICNSTNNSKEITFIEGSAASDYNSWEKRTIMVQEDMSAQIINDVKIAVSDYYPIDALNMVLATDTGIVYARIQSRYPSVWGNYKNLNTYVNCLNMGENKNNVYYGTENGIYGVVECDPSGVTISNIKENITDSIGLANIVDLQIQNNNSENMEITLLTSNGDFLQSTGNDQSPTVKRSLSSNMKSFCKNDSSVFVAAKDGELYTFMLK